MTASLSLTIVGPDRADALLLRKDLQNDIKRFLKVFLLTVWFFGEPKFFKEPFIFKSV